MLIILFTNCKEKKGNKEKLINEDLIYSEKTIRNDTIDLSTTSKTIELAGKFFNSNIYSINATIHFNNSKLNPYYGSIPNSKSKLYSFSNVKGHKYIGDLSISNENKIIIVNLMLCNEIDEILPDYKLANLNLFYEKSYLEDGGAIRILKFYCLDSSIIIVGLNKPNHINDIHPKCEHRKDNIPAFIDRIAIYDKEEFFKNNSPLSYNSKKDEIIEKVEWLCK